MSSSNKIDVPEMPDFDLERYLGKWYEIARIDHHYEEDLDYTTAEYSMREDGNVQVVNRGYNTEKDKWKESDAKAEPTDVKNFFKVYFIPLIAGKYRVAYVSDDYTYAVVSGGTKRYLWFLSRTPQVSDDQMNKMKSVATGLGYDLSDLTYPKQK